MAATSWKQGPFGVQSGMTLVVDLQAFLVVMSLMAILLSASIAERESTRAALLEGDERFRVLAESSPDVIMRFDRAYRHSYVNPAVEGQTGIPARVSRQDPSRAGVSRTPRGVGGAIGRCSGLG